MGIKINKWLDEYLAWRDSIETNTKNFIEFTDKLAESVREDLDDKKNS